MIGVKSRKEVIKGRYDGQDYVFKPGVTVALSEEAATHIFGYGLDDKTRALIRLGWLQHSTSLEDALARLDEVQFLSEAKVEFKEPPAPEGTQTAPPPPDTGLKIPTFVKSA